MSNLIPQPAKKKLRIEYWVRVASVWLMLLSGVLVVSAAVLFPTYVLISGQAAAHKESVAEASEKVASYETLSNDLVRASQQAKMVLDETGLSSLSSLIKLFENLQGPEIQITELSISRTEDGFAPVVVSGVATDRVSLASFRDRVLLEAAVDSVDLPISNLTTDKDISFNITIVMSNETSV